MKSEKTMVTTRSHGFLLAALLLVLAVILGPSSCRPTDVQCGDVLDLDYHQYRLTGDLVCPFGGSLSNFAAVTITGEGVHFNLAGYTITRDDATGRGLSQGIMVRGANAHINGGSIVDINCPDLPVGDQNCAGIFLGEAPGARINGMSLHNNTVGIISFSSDSLVGNADGARIHTNDITGNLRGGIILSGFGGATAEGAMITGNDLSDTGGFSFGGQGYIGTSDGVSLIGNVANNCAEAGILLFGSGAEGVPEGNTIRDNTTLDNGRAGIASVGATLATSPSDNLIQSNTAFGNCLLCQQAIDLNERAVGGGVQDCLNTWVDNDFGVAGKDCIE